MTASPCYPPSASVVGYAHAMADAARQHAARLEAADGDPAAVDVAGEHAAAATTYDLSVTYHLGVLGEAAHEPEAG